LSWKILNCVEIEEGVTVCYRKKMHKEEVEMEEREGRVKRQVIN
jgi:hypothetical protein